MKIKISPYPLIHPTTIAVIGTIYEGKSNFTTIGDVAVAGLYPPLVMISLHERHAATTSILETGKMSLNIPTKALMKKVDYCGMNSAKKGEKSFVFDHHIIDDLPIINASPISLILSVNQKVQIEKRIIFVCDVVETMVEEVHVKNKMFDFSNIAPLLYGLDNKYYSNTNVIGVGYQEGRNLK